MYTYWVAEIVDCIEVHQVIKSRQNQLVGKLYCRPCFPACFPTAHHEQHDVSSSCAAITLQYPVWLQ